MNNPDKVRIYDLAREKTPKDLDEKFQKKVQAEITRQIIKVAPKFGQHPKTASSSIAASSVDDIFTNVHLEDIIEEATSSKPKSKTAPKRIARVSGSPESSEEEAPKRKLKIVRRLTPVKTEEEEPEKEEEKEKTSPEATEEEAITTESPETEEAEEDLEEEVEEEEPEAEDHVKDMIATMQKGQKNKSQKPSSAMPITKLKNIQSIPLRPSAPAQPYRVGKPTIASQGMGRKKRRPSPDEDRPKKIKQKKAVIDEGPKEITITEAMTVRELAHKLSIPETNIITYFFMKKVVKTVNELLEKDLIVEFTESLGYIVHTEKEEELTTKELKTTLAEDESQGQLSSRPPVVTIMGHVDHGKTTLLDSIRKSRTKIVEQESGGITQHIAAYQVTTKDYDENDRLITFLDTPGHEAFVSMRRRGANVTDMVVLIVAADDGVMPQTLESIKHIKEAKVPFLVAVNKIDKPGAAPDKVLGQLAEHDIVVEQYGGPVVCSMISALSGDNLDELLEKIILVADAELSEKIRSNPDRLAIGTVVEAELSRAKGPLATILVQNGTLKKGDNISVGSTFGRIKAMFNDLGQQIDEAPPSVPVKILGLADVPKAGDSLKAHKTQQEAKKESEELASKELEEKRFRGLSAYVSEIQEGQEKEFSVIIKADVQGSAEAVSQELGKLSTGEVLVKPISIDSGSITTKDVELASRTGAVIVGFHVGSDAQTAKLAQKLDVKIKTYEVIYELKEAMEHLVLGLHDPDIEEVKLGMAEVRQLFTFGKAKKVAGCYVKEGKVQRREIARLFREGVQIYEGHIDYLRRFKDDAKEVKAGLECGLSFEKFNDIQEGDVIECWTIKKIAKTKL